MSELQKIIDAVNEDYLIGLCNKGVVKRAYKDKSETKVEIQSIQEEAVIQVAEETVKIRIPLAESECSCPSRTICRHVILGILILQEQKNEDDACNDIVQENLENTHKTDLLKEMMEYSVESLQKKLGKRYEKVVKAIVEDRTPKLQYSEVITVELDEVGERVTLLSPLIYSSCTCHKKEFCVHKAEAVFWCRYLNGQISREEVFEIPSVKDDGKKDEITKTTEEIRLFLLELAQTGLSRTSKDIMDYAQRLAIMAHNSQMPDFEGYLRALGTTYEDYFKRVSSFQIYDLFQQILRLYARCDQLAQAEDEMALQSLVGRFRAEYNECGALTLEGVTSESFETDNGYVGETVYFLERMTEEWYTYTVSRPVFYDNGGRKRRLEKSPAPWGLEMPVEAMSNLSLKIEGAKCDDRNRLSSTKDCRAVVLNRREFVPGPGTPFFYEDFSTLFAEQFGAKKSWLSAKTETEPVVPVFVQAAYGEKPYFRESEQTLHMTLYDEVGRQVHISVPYSKKDDWIIHRIERIHPESPKVVFGIPYLKDRRIHIRPIALFDGKNSTGKAGEAFETKQDTYKIMLEVFGQIQSLQEDIFQSGFFAVSDSIVTEIERLEGKILQLGLKGLQADLKQLRELLGNLRHRFTKEKGDASDLLQVCRRMSEYIYLGRQKAIYDDAGNYYKGKREIE